MYVTRINSKTDASFQYPIYDHRLLNFSVTDGLTVNANSNSMFDIRSETKECISETTKHDIITTQDSSPDSPKLEEDEEMMQNGCKNYTTELNNDQSSSSIQCNPLNEETPTLNGNITVQRIDSEPYDSPNGLCRH